jgi:hypothetical protein
MRPWRSLESHRPAVVDRQRVTGCHGIITAHGGDHVQHPPAGPPGRGDLHSRDGRGRLTSSCATCSWSWYGPTCSTSAPLDSDFFSSSTRAPRWPPHPPEARRLCLHRARPPFQELNGASGASYRAGRTARVPGAPTARTPAPTAGRPARTPPPVRGRRRCPPGCHPSG